MLSREIFSILTAWITLSWVSESLRQDIGQFVSPRMNLASSAEKSHSASNARKLEKKIVQTIFYKKNLLSNENSDRSP